MAAIIDAPKQAKLDFEVCVHTTFGDRVFVVGSARELGNWCPASGVELRTTASTYPLWEGSAHVPRGALQYKFVVLQPCGHVRWEDDRPNRCLDTIEMEAQSLKRGEVAQDLPSARFGIDSPECRPAHALVPDGGFPRDSSLTSTFMPDDESPEVSRSSSCISGVFPPEEVPRVEACLEPAAPAAPPTPPPPVQLWASARRKGKESGCEDSFFFSDCSLGVADGVGCMVNFREYGVCAADYAQELIELSARSLHSQRRLREPSDEPKAATLRAARAIAVAEEKAKTYGAATIVVAELDKAVLGVANLGDSGFMVLRPQLWGMQILKRSREMNHSWNLPYQLMRLPQKLLERYTCSFDGGGACEKYSVDVQAGDLVLLYSDGFSDNLFEYQVLGLVDTIVGTGCNKRPKTSPGRIAEVLASAAYNISTKAQGTTPFSKNAAVAKIANCHGGKRDDITVVAAWVVADGSVADVVQDIIVSTIGKPECAHDLDMTAEVVIEP